MGGLGNEILDKFNYFINNYENVDHIQNIITHDLIMNLDIDKNFIFLVNFHDQISPILPNKECHILLLEVFLFFHNNTQMDLEMAKLTIKIISKLID